MESIKTSFHASMCFLTYGGICFAIGFTLRTIGISGYVLSYLLVGYLPTFIGTLVENRGEGDMRFNEEEFSSGFNAVIILGLFHLLAYFQSDVLHWTDEEGNPIQLSQAFFMVIVPIFLAIQSPICFFTTKKKASTRSSETKPNT